MWKCSPIFKDIPTKRQRAFRVWGSVLSQGHHITCSWLCYNRRSAAPSGLAGLYPPLVHSLGLETTAGPPWNDSTSHLDSAPASSLPAPGGQSHRTGPEPQSSQLFSERSCCWPGAAMPEILLNASASTFKPWVCVSWPCGLVLLNFMMSRWSKFMTGTNVFTYDFPQDSGLQPSETFLGWGWGREAKPLGLGPGQTILPCWNLDPWSLESATPQGAHSRQVRGGVWTWVWVVLWHSVQRPSDTLGDTHFSRIQLRTFEPASLLLRILWATGYNELSCDWTYRWKPWPLPSHLLENP